MVNARKFWGKKGFHEFVSKHGRKPDQEKITNLFKPENEITIGTNGKRRLGNNAPRLPGYTRSAREARQAYPVGARVILGRRFLLLHSGQNILESVACI